MDMTIARAKLKSGPLRFGDPEQIDAVQFITAAERAAGAIKSCTHGSGVCSICGGAGECPHCGGECGKCCGDGIIGECECLDRLTPEHIKAGEQIMRERPGEDPDGWVL